MNKAELQKELKLTESATKIYRQEFLNARKRNDNVWTADIAEKYALWFASVANETLLKRIIRKSK